MTSIVIVVLGGGMVLGGLTKRTNTSTGQAEIPTMISPSAATLREITLLAAGDVIVHPPVWEQARSDSGGNGYAFAPIFEDVSGTIGAADLALCHLETPIAPAGAAPSGYPLFNAPAELLDGLKQAGFDGCSTASNHVLDQGFDGIKRTLDAMDAAGLGHAGSARTAEEAATPKIYDVGGVRVAHLSYTYGFNGLKPPAGKEWAANLIDPSAIKAAARKARESQADIVVLSLHAGTEYKHTPNADQERWAKEVLAGPEIDVLLGHHSHSVQAVEQIGEKWAIYGLGNQVARPTPQNDKDREGVMVRLTLTETAERLWRVTKAEAIPTWLQLTPKLRVIELPRAVADEALPAATRKTYQATLDRIAGHLRLRGAAAGGLMVFGASEAG
ncbi:CapA family protein [Allorhizocola rhizosphaerae]|uniref:CapA family protein n=1 Tax=Allorhizocola rhizosphaerae TaxID=1872709 RepID=UPI000E3C2BD1|nr:CapA family protein [Allorhizocola rhizosphaerae]